MPVNDSRSPVSTHPLETCHACDVSGALVVARRTLCVDRTYSASTPTGPTYK